MKIQEDIRWEQQFSNYKAALLKLKLAVEKISANLDFDTEVDEMIQESLIKRFEYTHELAWKVMKRYAEYQGNFEIKGSRDATREAFKMKMIGSEESATLWLNMIKSRNESTHTYNHETANELADLIIEEYFPLFVNFEKTMEKLKNTDENNLFEKEL